MCEVVNIKTGEPYDVYIGRPGKWGNPYSHRDDTKAVHKAGSRKEAVELYERYLFDSGLVNELHELQDKVLGCWCHPKACHGHVLKKYVDRLEKGLPLNVLDL